MFARLSAFTAIALIASAVALPNVAGGPGHGGNEVNQCNTGTINCCKSVHDSDSPAVGLLAGLLGILNLGGGQVGVHCSPHGLLNIGGNSCSAQPVCCSGNNFSGLIVLGCSPININL